MVSVTKCINEYDKKYGFNNLMRFRVVSADMSPSNLLNDIEEILKNSSNIENKHVLFGEDVIEIINIDNKSSVFYFHKSAQFSPDTIEYELQELCNKFNVVLEKLEE